MSSAEDSEGFPERWRRVPLAIPRSHRLSPEQFKALHVRNGSPVIVPGLADAWPARSWTLDTLAAVHRGVHVPTLETLGGEVVVDPRRGLVTRPVPLDRVIGDLRRAGDGPHDRRHYVMARADQLPGALGGGFGERLYTARSLWSVRKLWIGPAGTRSALHFDLSHNLHTQLIGSKRFTLFAPAERANLYPQSLLSGVPNASQLRWEAPNLQRFPRVERAQPWIGTLGPGETLFLPKGWWHFVETLEASVSANTWWATGRDLAVVMAAGAFKRAYGISR